jgi:hypothetical protein
MRYVPAGDRSTVDTGLTTIGGTGRRALADLRELLGVLSPQDPELIAFTAGREPRRAHRRRDHQVIR